MTEHTFKPRRTTGSNPCEICGDAEPSHVHYEGGRIEDYFTVGRGESDFAAAQRWQRRATDAELHILKLEGLDG